ncbi:GIY-YIG nuclease family protein [Mycoplasmatota bacterium WC44]
MESNSKLYLNDLIRIEDLSSVKIKFNRNAGDTNPIELYAKSPEVINTEWLFWRTEQRHFNVGETAICLVRMQGHFWLLTTIKKVVKELGVTKGINYEGDELQEYASLYGRTIIKFHKTFQRGVRYAEGLIDELEVVQILPAVYEGDDFPGYDKVRLPYNTLKTIIDRNKRDWVSALENQKAVYLIRDSKTGKLYVGSATGENGMLLQRWKNYVHNGHGGNKDLVKIVDEKGFDYVKDNFVYSILENYNSRVDKKSILERESWWKETLGTRTFGYNKN